MVFEVATVLLGVDVGVCVGAVAVLYAASRGYLGHSRRRGSSAEVALVETILAPAVEQLASPADMEVASPAAMEVTPLADVAPAPAEPTPSPAPALYETVQPVVSPAPIAYVPSSVATFGASPAFKKPTRTYRRRTAPVRSNSASKAPRSTKAKKR